MENLDLLVKAVNRANKTANELYPVLFNIFAKLVGCKLDKVDRTFLKQVEKLLPKFPCTPREHIFRHTSDYSLAFTVKVCEIGENACEYFETTVYIGEMRNGELIKLTDPYIRKTDYSVEEITRLRAEAKAAKDAYEEAKSKLYPFKEY
jgi:hypothetical protein